MNPGDRRQELRREEDEVVTYRVTQLEEQIRVFAPVATQVAIHEHQIDEAAEERRSLRAEFVVDREATKTAMAELLNCVNNIKVKVEGMQVKLAFIVGIGAMLGGAAASALIALVTS